MLVILPVFSGTPPPAPLSPESRLCKELCKLLKRIDQQGDINCEASPQAELILNYFLSNFLSFPLKFSISSQPGWQAGTINVALLQTRKVLENTALFHRSPDVDNTFQQGDISSSSLPAGLGGNGEFERK